MIIGGWAVTVAALVCAVIVPLTFESYTFYLYSIGEPSFFTFSGARLWVFLTALFLSGMTVGLANKLVPLAGAGMAAVAVFIVILLTYHICDSRQCYYAGPDGLGELRLSLLLLSTGVTGVAIGSILRPTTASNVNGDGYGGASAFVFGTSTCLFLGFFPWALLYASYLSPPSDIAVLALALVVPFFISGMVVRRFLGNSWITALLSSAGAAWLVITVLFVPLRPFSALLSGALLLCALATTVAGFMVGPRAMQQTIRKSVAPPIVIVIIIIISLLSFFALGATHPSIGGPMNLSIEPEGGLLPQPTLYSGAYHQSDTYFPTKRVDVGIDWQAFGAPSISDNNDDNSNNHRNYLMAGIGAQSPNCCKDGLDYGYRADLLFNGSGVFLVARAWEACDYNIACSGFPWVSLMHQSVIPLPAEATSLGKVSLAMAWQPDGRTAKWYYLSSSLDRGWVEYSEFLSPEIENPYFNPGGNSGRKPSL